MAQSFNRFFRPTEEYKSNLHHIFVAVKLFILKRDLELLPHQLKIVSFFSGLV